MGNAAHISVKILETRPCRFKQIADFFRKIHKATRTVN